MKTFLDRIQSALFVVTRSRQWAPSTAREIADFLRPFLAEGEEMPDLGLLQELFARALEARQRTMEEADEAHRRVTQERRALLRVRATATRKLTRLVVDLRTLLKGFVGTARANLFLSLKGETSRDPVVLLRQAGYAVKGLRDRARSLELASYQPFDRKGWASAIDGAAKALATAIAEVSGKHKQIDLVTHQRQRALDELNDAFVTVAGWLEATYHVAGHEERAEAVKPSRQRRGRLVQEVRRSARRSALKRARKAAAESIAAPASASTTVHAESQVVPFAPLRRVVRFLSGRGSTPVEETRSRRLSAPSGTD